MGLQYVDVSTYQMLRGSGVIFIALMKQYVLNQYLVSGVHDYILFGFLVNAINFDIKNSIIFIGWAYFGM